LEQSVGFVFDPTGLSGTSVLDQLSLRAELHERVTRARSDCQWLDIVSKVDQPSADIESIHSRCVQSAFTWDAAVALS